MKDGNFTKLPNEIFQLYTQIPGFTGEHALMYAVLTSYYNDEYGYAFPDQYELKLRLNCGINKVGRLAKKLKDVGLIDYRRKYSGGNYVYYVKQPIKDAQLFYERFPEAKAHYEAESEALDRRKEAMETDSMREIADWL